MGSLTRGGDRVPYRGLPWGALRETEIASGRRDLLCEARGEAEGLVGSNVAGEGPMAYLIALFFYGTLVIPLMFARGTLF